MLPDGSANLVEFISKRTPPGMADGWFPGLLPHAPHILVLAQVWQGELIGAITLPISELHALFDSACAFIRNSRSEWGEPGDRDPRAPV